MPYSVFHDRFPDIAERETRNIHSINEPDLPADTYSLFELYCDEPGCDCRRVMFHIWAEDREEFVATIVYGWEDKKFYRQWLGDDDPEKIDELKGPALNRLSYQSDVAPALLRIVRDVVLRDRSYVNRLKRHYRLFRDAIEQKHEQGVEAHASSDHFPSEPASQVRSKKIGRNDPCPCGSGRKYKHCCMT